MIVLHDARSDSDRPALGGCAIRSSVERRLQRSGYTALSRVCCEFQTESGVLHLRGAVPSYYLKQVAQELVVDLEGVRSLITRSRSPDPLGAGGPKPAAPGDADASPRS